MTIYLIKGYLDVAATSLADAQSLFTAMLDPSTTTNQATIDRVTAKLETLVQSDTGEPLTISSIDDAAGTISAWVTDASTVAVALGDPDPQNTRQYAGLTAAGFSISGSTRTGTLPLNTTALRDALSLNYGQPGRWLGSRFTFQVQVTSGGYTETKALLPVNVRAGVLTATPTEMDPASYLTAAQIAAGYAPRAFGNNSQTVSAAGTTTLSIASTLPEHTEVITITGVAGTYVVVLPTTSRSAGDIVNLHVVVPATAAIVVDIRNATAVGTQLLSYTTDTTSDPNLYLLAEYTGTAWRRLLTSAA